MIFAIIVVGIVLLPMFIFSGIYAILSYSIPTIGTIIAVYYAIRVVVQYINNRADRDKNRSNPKMNYNGTFYYENEDDWRNGER